MSKILTPEERNALIESIIDDFLYLVKEQAATPAPSSASTSGSP